MTKLEQALSDPSGVYRTPDEVVKDPDLTRKEKIKILHVWHYDALDLAVASEENMAGSDEDSMLLPQILQALRALGVEHDSDEMPPTKHGA
ncbi:MAG: hypothetical protein V3V61_06490 [Gammaproteobacteria bacterium]